MGLSGASTTATGPAALVRGGGFADGALAGPFTVFGGDKPSVSGDFGFRGAR